MIIMNIMISIVVLMIISNNKIPLTIMIMLMIKLIMITTIITIMLYPMFSPCLQERLDELHRLWALLLMRLGEKGTKLQQAQQLVQFLRITEEVMFWISDKEAFVSSGEIGQDLEHVEVLQKKFDEFQKVRKKRCYSD